MTRRIHCRTLVMILSAGKSGKKEERMHWQRTATRKKYNTGYVKSCDQANCKNKEEERLKRVGQL